MSSKVKRKPYKKGMINFGFRSLQVQVSTGKKMNAGACKLSTRVTLFNFWWSNLKLLSESLINLLVTQYGGHNNNSHQHKACCNGWPNDAVHANIQSRHTCQKEKADGQEPSSNSDVAPWFIVFVHFLIAKILIYNIFK